MGLANSHQRWFRQTQNQKSRRVSLNNKLDARHECGVCDEPRSVKYQEKPPLTLREYPVRGICGKEKTEFRVYETPREFAYIICI